ncbi:hypothetical protein QFW77_05455 [Luteimonas sp. RD2P54]|uniref:Uncharacterized protein n=1 Tax=Luteimonas endophytica TaxID=3042023 RepID=A0ABT6J6J0_9GAMM|nr:hypothetical protein [Luteimonas endophytica]MDH5822436.1 hypothetical protein [Luteimonas endophytica]
MTDIVLRDVDDILADRIRRVADRRGWDLPHTLLHLLERGLHVCEDEGAVRFDSDESEVLQQALEALRGVPDDPGYSLIGRVRPPPGREGAES